MAARRKTANSTELPGNSDPRAQLDGAALLGAVKPLLKELAADLLVRADGSLAVTEALKARHAAEQQAERTADGYPEWRRGFVEQVAAAWLLSCVFVRTLEDRGLLGRNRIAGPGAEDSWKAFQQLAPSLSEREYLLAVFKELSRLPAAADLFDVRHNPVWLLGPSAEKARTLLDLFRAPTSDAPRFRFGGEDTRFLGDLYEDLSEDVRKRFALLQTPRFVERFILDRTLEPAIDRFGLSDTNLIDPTCGSGHFLLGAFERLFDHRLRAEPGLTAREAATKALDAVAGSDINAYAVAVARFRLTLAFIEKCGIARLKDVPRLPLHLAVADSLLYNPQIGQLALVEGTDAAKWEGAHFSLEDPKAARDVLFKQYAAVVGNPPYITVKDAVLRERYRKNYVSAFRSYSLGVPFTERFFQLGRAGAVIGMITANSFMKREFGRILIEEYLPTVNLELIVNTSGAYIPGHGIPTALLFGTNEKPKGDSVLAVLANRGEPTTPSDPERGVVWSSIAQHWHEVGFNNAYISVARSPREGLSKHPWSLGGGGTGELKDLLEERAEGTLGQLDVDVGTGAVTREDDVYILGAATLERLRIPRQFRRPLVVGENVRDWAISDPALALWPYELATLEATSDERARAFLWPWRTRLSDRVAFGKTQAERGLPFTAYSMFFANRFRGPTISFAFVATHNHFVLDRDEKVFGRTAPIIKLPETATEDDHLALLAYLNSSIAGFFFRQVLHSKGAQGVNEGHKSEEWEQFIEYAGTQIASIPLPPGWQSLAALARVMLKLVGALHAAMPREQIARWSTQAVGSLTADFGTGPRDQQQRLVAIQEEIDWKVYSLFGLLDVREGRDERKFSEQLFGDFAQLDCRASSPFPGALAAGHRAFELLMNPQETQWFRRNGYAEDGDPDSYGEPTSSLLRVRMSTIDANPKVRILEQPQYKRRWTLPDVAGEASREVRQWALGSLEKTFDTASLPGAVRLSVAWLRLEPARTAEALRLYLGGDAVAWCRTALKAESVPFLAALRHSESGLEKRAVWEATWDLQRREDGRESVGHSIVPPKYDQKDFRDALYFTFRGKLDVPNERFISYPGCESDEDKDPVYGWAGWDHLQRAVALAGLYQDRKQREGWSKDRLLPMLAGLLELLPWLKQWHHEPNADLGGERPSDQFDAFLNTECAELGFTHDDLRAWRPATKVRASANPKTRGKSKTEPEESAGTP